MPEPRNWIVSRPGSLGPGMSITADDFEATDAGVTFYNEVDADVLDLVAFFSHPVNIITSKAVAE